MRKPDFYRQRARVAEEIAKHWRDEIAKQMLLKAADRWRELAALARRRRKTRAAASSNTKKRKAS
jgi:hypothetical protein